MFFSGSLEDSYQTSTTPTTIISFMVIIVNRSNAGNFNDNILEPTQNSKISDTKLGPNVCKKVPKFQMLHGLRRATNLCILLYVKFTE